MNKKHSVAVNCIFLVLIFGFTAATLFSQKRERSETENRPLQMMPALNMTDLLSGSFAKDYEKYLSDQFIWRDKWITLKTDTERAMLKQDISGVYFAKDDYLIESHAETFTTDRAENNITTLTAFLRNMSDCLGIGHVSCMIIPNAVDILRDKLPPFAQPYDEEIYLKKIQDALPESVFVPTTQVLKGADDAGIQVFYRTDHHWTSEAAFETFRQWLLRMGIGFADQEQYTSETVTDDFHGTISSKLGIPGRADSIQKITSLDAPKVELTIDGVEGMSVYDDAYLLTKDKYAYFYGGNHGLVEAVMPENRTGRRLLIIKDSYAHCFTPLTYNYFDEVDMVDPRYYNQSINELIESKGYTDVLFLFNASGFAEEAAIARLLA